MPIPELNDFGLLPPGIHDCTLDEVQERFGRFQTSDQRVQLFGKLNELVANLRASRLVTSLMIDGSFVTAKHNPSDVDIVIGTAEQLSNVGLMKPMDYNAVSRNRIKRKYRFDALVAPDGSDAHREYIDFFTVEVDANKLPTGRSKGLLKVQL
ncbi:MAG: hypothetical protein O3A46_05465 [Candidatus Poribacteria bacterium]|nr:hypothetical protein [Candidatus Poribacteria bacterium]